MNAVATMSATSMTRQVAWFIFLFFLSSVYGQVSYSIPEEMAIGSFIGNVAQDLSISLKRLNSGNARIYTTGSAEYIELDRENGVLLIKERIDRESLCGKTSPCALYFQLVLDNPMEFFQVTIEIIDINDNAPDFLKTEMTFEISESAHTAAKFLLEKAVDPDIGINGLQSYKLEPTDNFLLKLHSQTDGSKNVEMILQKPLDRETRDKLTLLLTAMDGGDPPMSGTVQIYINVLDANDNAPVFSRPIYKAAVTENVSRGTVLTKVSASDLDQGSNGEIKYSISRSIDMMFNLFEIDENSGEVRLVGEMDYEKAKRHQIDIKAKDHGGLSDSCKVIIDVIDVNDHSPIINLMSKSKSVHEDSHQNTVVAIMTVQDPDSENNGKVHCRIDENIPFSIRSTSNDFYSLVTGSSLDRETQSEYNITVICADEGIPSLSSSVILNLQISDVNDNVPVFEQSSYVTYVLENNTPGVSIFSVKASDADWNQNSRVSYILEDSSVNGVPVSSYVSVNSDSGVVHAVRSLDYEQIKDFQFRVKAQDGGSPPLSNNVTVKVFILDQNDNSPQILYPVHTGSSLVTELVPHSADVGYLVTKVVAVDVDSGQNAWLSYKLLKPADRPLFEVGLQNGEIRTIRQISDKDSVRQKLTIVVEDNGKPPRSASVSVNVAVADSFPEVLSEFNDFTYDKKYNDNLTFYLILALAVVSFLFVVSIVTIISAKCYRWRRERMFYKSGGNLPVIPYYPPLYADVGGTGTLQHAYNYDTCRSTDSRMSDVKYVRPCSQSVLHVDLSGKETVTREKKDDPNIFEEVSPYCLSYFTSHSL